MKRNSLANKARLQHRPSRCLLSAGGALLLTLVMAAPYRSDSSLAWQQMVAAREMVNRFLIQRARELTDRAALDFQSKATWEKVREQRRRELLDMLGLDPLPARTPLNATITGTLDKPEYTIEKLAFQSLPRLYATANLYVPKKRNGPAPAIIYVCGHSASPFGSKVQYQHHAITFARHGYVCLIIDPIQIAETFALHHGVYNLEMADWYSRGYTPAGVEVWNVIRALDYLETRPEVDRDRMGITGRSGGAAMSWFSAAVDTRLKVAVPVMGNSTYAANVAANTQKGHCDCMFPINTYQHDLMTQGALIAPRPLHMMHGKQDTLFPVPGYQEFEEIVGQLYRDYGAADRFQNTVVDTGHQDSDFLREQAVRWFDRYLMKTAERPIDLKVEKEDPANLAVFGGNPPASALNFQVHERWTTHFEKPNVSTPERWQARRTELMKRLRQIVFRAFPDKRGDLDLQSEEEPVDGGFKLISFSPSPGVRLRLWYRGIAEKAEALKPVLVYIASNGEDHHSIRRTLNQLSREEVALLIVQPRGIGEVPWNKETERDMLRNAMHVGETIDSMRLWDVLRSLDVLRSQPGIDLHRITILGRGVSGILGGYAAILDESVQQVMLIDPPVSHRQGPIFLNVLRYTDLPEAMALLAPRRLVFFGRVPEEYRPSQAVYELLGKPDHISVSMSVKAVVEGRYDHNFSSGY
ncbi:MAG: alpha/beta hydrolase [Acidobacteriota bacterium]